jgi:hypothetical protein
MNTLTKKQLASEYVLCATNHVVCIDPNNAVALARYTKLKRNGQSFAVTRADRKAVFASVCQWNRGRVAWIAAKESQRTGYDYEEAILKRQEVRDYGHC